MDPRRFAAIHDRFLDPPDEDFDEEGDECDLADIKRQKRIDEEDFEVEQNYQRDLNSDFTQW